MSGIESKRPLVVDLDGTLIKSDVLVETLFKFLKIHPLKIITIIRAVSQDKTSLKRLVSENVEIDPALLPYDDDVISLITREKECGRKVILATATSEKYAQKINAYLGLFDDVLATSDTINLASENKAKKLVELYGDKGFDYAGNSSADLSVWKNSHQAILVNPDFGVEKKATKSFSVSQVIKNKPPFAKTLIKALRVHQWMKNLLIFVPLAAAHQLDSGSDILLTAIAFIMFGLCASSVYLLNDILDLDDDRHHPRKRKRPFASGDLDVRIGLLLIPILLISVFVFSLWLFPPEFLAVLVGYYMLTLAYSFKLKSMVIVDVLTLACLYTIRIIAGAAAMQLTITFWILAFSMFIFLSLALVKRYAELFETRKKGAEKARGRGYEPNDLEMLSSLGASSGYLSVLVLALYIHDISMTGMYTNPEYIWLACPLLLYWISRTWMITHRGLMHDDPVVFAVKDRVSRVVGLLFIIVFWGAM